MRPIAITVFSGIFIFFPLRYTHAIKPEAHHYSDAKRFHLDQVQTQFSPTTNLTAQEEALSRFNAKSSVNWQTISSGQGFASGEEPHGIAMKFLKDNQAQLGIHPEDLHLELAHEQGGIHHFLFQQRYQGLPVEFAQVKLHVSQQGKILGMQSSHRLGLQLDTNPVVTEAEAAQSVQADLGMQSSAAGSGKLVFYPKWQNAELRLAWKFSVSGPGGRWVYYIDAYTGQVLFRYNDLRFQTCPSAGCMTSGKVTGEVFDIDPNMTPGPSIRPMDHQRMHVYQSFGSIKGSTVALTDANGCYCSNTPGRIFSSLQGPFVNVANFKKPSAHYDNGGGVWNTFSTPISSPHPYPNNAVLISTITTPDNALKFLPNFSSFDVGSLSAEGIGDNDQVAIENSSGVPVAVYTGSLGAFLGAAVSALDFPDSHRFRLNLRSDAAGTRTGFDVNISSYLVFPGPPSGPDPATFDAATSTFTWTATRTFDGTRDEINLFYHLNKMHDYFRNGVNSGGASVSTSAFIDRPVVAMARVGPNFANAFYDPVYKYLAFGDAGNGFALDASVVRHEYVHFVVDQIYPVINFGQYGALSEALADYFSASSLGISSIGKFTNASFGNVGALRELNCPTNTPCRIFPTNWSGAIHEDSLILSQALWEIRTTLMQPGNLGAVNGQACADGLVFQSLFFFPSSFQEFLQAMLQVSALSQSLVPICGPNNAQTGLIEARFSVHGVTRNPLDEDRYEPNNGIQSATDISTASAISARIFPGADIDTYAISAAPGPLRFRLNLPDNPLVPRSFFAYRMTLIDRQFNVLAVAEPPINVNPTFAGACPDIDCMTTSQQVLLEYSNPSSNQLFLQVSAAYGDNGSNSRTSSTRFYTLQTEYPQIGSISAGIVTAVFDRDRFNFSVLVSTFARAQNPAFHGARLRDQGLSVLPQTDTREPSSFLTWVSTTESGGIISGQLDLRSGFAARFPAIGTVYLEVFGINRFSHIQSLGLSSAINLSTDQQALSAWNNVFNPARGEKATIKYEILSPGHVSLRLYTLNGTLVSTLVDEFKPTGKGSVDWHGVNSIGNRVASGIYLLHLDAPGVRKTQKVIVVK